MENISSNSTEFTLRNITKDDIPMLLDFIRQLAEYERLSDDVVATAEELEYWLFGDRIYAEAWLGYEGKEPVAFALFFTNFSTFIGRPGLYLEDVFVKPEYRGKGYGKKILKDLAQLALERGYGRFEWSVLDWNKPSIDFYLSLGAQPMDEWTVFRMDRKQMYNLVKES